MPREIKTKCEKMRTKVFCLFTTNILMDKTELNSIH